MEVNVWPRACYGGYAEYYYYVREWSFCVQKHKDPLPNKHVNIILITCFLNLQTCTGNSTISGAYCQNSACTDYCLPHGPWTAGTCIPHDQYWAKVLFSDQKKKKTDHACLHCCFSTTVSMPFLPLLLAPLLLAGSSRTIAVRETTMKI